LSARVEQLALAVEFSAQQIFENIRLVLFAVNHARDFNERRRLKVEDQIVIVRQEWM